MADLYGGWQPTTRADLLECERDPYITRAGVVPDWVRQLRNAARECRAGHPSGSPANGRCGRFGCRGRT